MSIDITKLEEKLTDIVGQEDQDSFLYSLLETYDFPKSTITLLKKDPSKLSKKDNEIILKNKVLFHVITETEDEHEVIDNLMHSKGVEVHKPRFIIVTDFLTFLAVDTKTSETLDIEFARLPKHFDFFLPWAGREKYRGENESPADIKAATKMAKLYDQIINDNPDYVTSHTHELNLFLTRLLFCFFAEDAEIFPEGLFSNSIGSHTSDDGSDFKSHLENLFDVFNLEESNRDGLPDYLHSFPYVNGGLFEEKIELPAFSIMSRKLIIEAAALDWSEINPDIFGSMIQAVTHPGMREDLGMHYTSVSNILKVIEPLFLSELHEELEKAGDNVKKLTKLRERISKIKIFDPACGSGNFLIISYKKLCELEIQIIERIQATGADTLQVSGITLNNFYGIEIDDFAHEVARLSLWLTQHQMNRYFNDVFGMMKPTLPLQESGHIVCGNATRIDWKKICPRVDDSGQALEIYIASNPPYEGSRKQKKQQKEDLKKLFIKKYKSLDYISAWLYIGAEYISGYEKCSLAMVSTNSICQGEQVNLLWPKIFGKGVEIGFAHKSFKWKNLAKNNAGVTVIIIGLNNKNDNSKNLYHDGGVESVKHINPYLTEGPDLIVVRRSKPLTKFFPPMLYGNLLNDGGNLVLDRRELEDLLKVDQKIKAIVKKYVGSREFIRGEERWCVFIPEDKLQFAKSVPAIRERLSLVKKHRLESSEESTRKLANEPHKYYFQPHRDGVSLIVPRTSSENRDYIPTGFLDGETIISDAAQVIYGADSFIFGVLNSRMHMAWVRAVGGRLKTDLRYSSALCYNTFPFPQIDDDEKKLIGQHVFNVLDEREKYPEKTMKELYEPDEMPLGLQQAHQFLDEVIDRIYQKKPFESDEERLACLFKLYERMLADEQEK